MKRSSISVAALALTLGAGATAVAQGRGASCKVDGSMSRLAGVSEASGVAFSLRTPGAAWSHNDSGDPVIFAIAPNGSVGRQVRLTGAKVVDWEDIATGPCAGGNCLYIADIGDNNAARASVTIYRTPEPGANDNATAQVEVLHAKYPDGAHDAEALIVLPKGDMYIVTKGETGPAAIYRFPSGFQNGTTVTLQRVAVLGGGDANAEKKEKEKGGGGALGKADRITGADVSPDGKWIVLRTTEYVKFYPASEFVSGNAKETLRFDLTKLGEPQGEGVAFSKNGEVVLVGEGGGKGQPGTLTRISCTLK